MTVTQLPPSDRSALDPATVLIAQARRQMALRFSPADYPGLDFDAAVWDFRPVTAARATPPARLYFCELESNIPYPQVFADLVKAMIVLNRYQGRNAMHYADAFRFLWVAIIQRLKGAPFRWSEVIAADFEQAEQLLIARGLKPASIYSPMTKLNTLRKWLDENEVCEGVEWIPRTKDPKIERARTKVGRESRLDRLPTRRAIEGLGEIYRLHAKKPKDRLLICAIGLLLVAGFRIAELLTLPADCWVAEVHRGRERYGLRFWNRKTRGGRWQWAVRWLSPMGAELARDLLAEIRVLTHTARDQARVLERDPSRVVIPNTEGRDELFTREVAPLFGTNKAGLNSRLHDQRLKLPHRRSPQGKGRENLIPKAAVEAELLARRGALHTFDLGQGHHQWLSETLLIVHPWFLDDRTDAVLPLLVTTVKQEDIGVFLKSRKKGVYRLSAFERFGITEPGEKEDDASQPSAMRSHMARHWLNTVANKAGMSAFQISMWMQRADASQTLLYLHSASDIADLTREGMRDGTLAGRRVEEFNALLPEQQEDYLATIRSAHKTATGTCTADFGVDQCEVNKACELGCLFYLHTLGDPVERANLLAKRARFVLALEQIAAAERAGRQMPSRLREINEQWIAAIDRMLGLDELGAYRRGQHEEATGAA